MTFPSANRTYWLGMLFLLTVAAALWPVPPDEPAISMAANRRASSHQATPAKQERAAFAPLAAPLASNTAVADLFPEQSWAPVQVVEPSVPSAPPLPFSYGGSYTEGGNVRVLLTEGEQVYTARAGDMVKDNYRLEKIDGTSISFTYLPLGTRQTLATGNILR